MHILSHQERMARILGRRGRRLSSSAAVLAARQPDDWIRAGDGHPTTPASLLTGAMVVRLDPARETYDDVGWEASFLLPRQASAAPALEPVERIETSTEQPKLAEKADSPPSGRRSPRRRGAATTRAPRSEGNKCLAKIMDMVKDAATGNRSLDLLNFSGAASGDAVTASAAPASVDRNAALTEEVLSAEIRDISEAVATEDLFVDSLSFSGAASGETVMAFAEGATDSGAGNTGENLPFAEAASEAAAKAKEWLGLGEGVSVFLFAGEMSYAAGVDILADALVVVCQGHRDAQFVFVGAGPLKNDMERQVFDAGLAHRCRFTGDLLPAEFEKYLAACDVVVIPAREGQDSGLSERALSLGKPVLTTHQAQIRGIVHGHNGLVVYDCPNSLVWGLRELLARPLSPQESAARKAA